MPLKRIDPDEIIPELGPAFGDARLETVPVNMLPEAQVDPITFWEALDVSLLHFECYLRDWVELSVVKQNGRLVYQPSAYSFEEYLKGYHYNSTQKLFGRQIFPANYYDVRP